MSYLVASILVVSIWLVIFAALALTAQDGHTL